MTAEEFNRFCESLPRAHHVVQWGGAQVWKIGPKVFAIGWFEGRAHAITFKVSPMSFDLLKDRPGCKPAPYLASRGMKWIQRTGRQSMSDTALQDYIAESYRLVALGLPKKMRGAR
jgi:predicted DNA-binding protein (MmcQ/YjbR family)